jgi:sec-independent protein translocase protein TatA
MSASLFAVFGLGPMEMMIVGGIALLLFGYRLPSALHALGRSFKQFQKGLHDTGDEIAPSEVR